MGVTTIISLTTTNEFTWGYSHNQINIDAINDGLTRAKTGLTNLPAAFGAPFLGSVGLESPTNYLTAPGVSN